MPSTPTPSFKYPISPSPRFIANTWFGRHTSPAYPPRRHQLSRQPISIAIIFIPRQLWRMCIVYCSSDMNAYHHLCYYVCQSGPVAVMHHYPIEVVLLHYKKNGGGDNFIWTHWDDWWWFSMGETMLGACCGEGATRRRNTMVHSVKCWENQVNSYLFWGAIQRQSTRNKRGETYIFWRGANFSRFASVHWDK